MKTLFWWINIMICLLIPTTVLSDELKPSIHWGTAKNAKGEVVYMEKHLLHLANGKLDSSVTEYYTPDKKTIIATLNSEYKLDQKKPVYEFLDYRSGYKEGLRLSDGKYIAYRQSKNESEESKVIKSDEQLYACQGWHYFLINNFELIKNKKLNLSLILPGELDYFQFQITGTKLGNKKIKAKLEISNWLLKIFAPTLSLIYDTESSRLIEYKGVSNLLTKDSKRQEVIIKYNYESKG